VLVDELLTRQRQSEHYLWRALAASQMGRPLVAWGSLDAVAGSRDLSRGVAVEALALARRLGKPPKGSVAIPRLIRSRNKRR
jgi:hypothetical protein